VGELLKKDVEAILMPARVRYRDKVQYLSHQCNDVLAQQVVLWRWKWMPRNTTEVMVKVMVKVKAEGRTG